MNAGVKKKRKEDLPYVFPDGGQCANGVTTCGHKHSQEPIHEQIDSELKEASLSRSEELGSGQSTEEEDADEYSLPGQTEQPNGKLALDGDNQLKERERVKI